MPRTQNCKWYLPASHHLLMWHVRIAADLYDVTILYVKLIFDSANLRTCESGLELQLFGVLRLECSATSFVLIC